MKKFLEGNAEYPVESLPDDIRLYVQSLAARCSLPACVPATACLALVSGLAGKGFKLDRGLGAPVGVNLYFAVAVDPDSNFRTAVESVLRPAQQLQEELIGGEMDGRSPMGSRSPLAEWKQQQNGKGTRSLLLSSGNSVAEWEQLLESSFGGLFHYCWDEELMLEMVERANDGKRHPATTILKRAYTREVSVSSSKTKGQELQAPSMGLFWLCNRDGLGRFARNRPLLQDRVLRCFILADLDAEPAELTMAALEPTQGAWEWERVIRDMVQWRSGSEDQMWQVCAEGARLLGTFANVALKHMLGTVAPEYRMVPEWAGVKNHPL